ncbi:MAG: phosphate starvation-inducible protein PhoH [Parcubacteria group bacterium]|nr:phosphate starvation-inducible protein PhoH [Parcubacteria group bacterium]
MTKSYILDTSVYLTDSNAIRHYADHNIIIPFKVLEEIDNQKKRLDGIGANARRIIRTLDELREKGSLKDGVQIDKRKGFICVKNYESSNNIPSDLDLTDADNQIIAVALMERAENSDTILVSKDINMRVKCDALGLVAEDYTFGQLVSDVEYVYDGHTIHLVANEIIDKLHAGEDIFLKEGDIKLYPNQFVTLTANSNGKRTALVRFQSYLKPLKLVINYKKGIWGVKPRNREQRFTMDLLMDPDVPVVTLIGKAGSGKTLSAIASGLQQVVETGSGQYRSMIVSRPIQPLGNDIGFLPGEVRDKMAPWLAPIEDNLKFLMGNDRSAFELYVNNGTIEIEALTYIRGRSISNAFIVIDEVQNTSIHEIKTILTRVGENTKIVLMGDIEQIDNIYIDETTNGLTYVVEKFKDYELAGHVTLKKGERSDVASLAAKIL